MELSPTHAASSHSSSRQTPDLTTALRTCLVAAPRTGPDATLSEAVFAGMQTVPGVLAQRIDAVGTTATGATSGPAIPPSTRLSEIYLRGAIEQGCTVVLTVGSHLEPTIKALAPLHREIHFVMIAAALDLPNVHTVASGPANQIQQQVHDYIASLPHARASEPASHS